MPSDFARVASAIEVLSASPNRAPDLESLAEQIGLSAFHFQRMFRRMTGITPKKFSLSLAASRADRLLQDDESLTSAALGAGLSGPGRLHDVMVKILAMSPGELRNGGAAARIEFGIHESPFGLCLIATTKRGICEVQFVDSEEEALAGLQSRFSGAAISRRDAGTAAIAKQITTASRSEGPLTLHVKGTNFQVQVWKALLAIPIGQTATYGAIASRIGSPTAARAVGSAVGKNPAAVAIPCHRVLRASGVVGDYRWKPERKRALLAWEAAGA